MANIHDYLRWRGDISMREHPFNDVDNIVLSAFSYLDLRGIVPGERQGGSVRLGDACQQLVAQAHGDVTPYVRSFAKIDTQFVELVASSTRFGDARLSAYEDVVDKGRALQFAALQIDIADAGRYVVFRGTDHSIVGWRENFMLSFKITEAQQEAARYLERSLVRAADSNMGVRVGGHSKGGNLAEYAAICCPEHLRGYLLRVYSNDGPSLAPEVVPASSRRALGGLLRRFVPSYSVVGMLFAQEGEKRTTVKSTGNGIGQHDLTTWQVTRSGVEEAPGLLPDCVVLNQTIAQWANEIPLDERERVVTEVFDALGAGGATQIEQIASSPDGLQKVVRALGSTDGRTREIAATLAQRLMGSSVDAMLHAANKVREDTVRRIFGPKDITVRFSRKGKPAQVRAVPLGLPPA